MRHFLNLAILISIFIALAACDNSTDKPTKQKESSFAERNEQRQDFFEMRMGDISAQSHQKIQKQLQSVSLRAKSPNFQKKWRLEGPLNVNGRVNVLALHPSNKNEWLVGESTGGIFKTIDKGQGYYPVFDQFNYLGISALVYHPKDAAIVFAGTGDENISAYPFSGNGVYKSIDGGDNWAPFALDSMGIVSTICIHPTQPDTMLVATMGVPFVEDSLRGVYRTYDGGNSWEQVLLPSMSAGVIDMVMDYNDPQTIYAAAWTRVRNNSQSIASGPDSKLWVSRDGGDTWQTVNMSSSITSISRIGLTQSEQTNNRVYAVVVNANFGMEGVFYTDDKANNWNSIDASNILNLFAGFGWYFGQIRVNPFNTDKIYIPGVNMYEYSLSTGIWKDITADHVDHHDLDFISEDSIIASTDGGLFLTTDGGSNWSDIDDIPSTQFYRIAFNPWRPGEYWGGLQDNGTVKGNYQNLYAWNYMSGGDGFQVVFDRLDSNAVYVESQNGALGVLQYGYYDDFTIGIDANDTRSWDMPIINDKNNAMYTGTYRVYKNELAQYGYWTDVSGQLTNNTNSRYNVISALGVSEVNADYVYAGTTDGRVWNSPDAGSTWSEITTGLPDLYVTSVEASPSDAKTVYVGHSGYRDYINTPHLHKSSDLGLTWTSIAGDLPDLAVNAIVVLPNHNDSILFVATDGGVFGSINSGTNWNRVGNNMPIIAVYDLVFDSLKRNLVAGTYARGMHSIPIDSIIDLDYTDAIYQAKVELQLKVYPNPTSDFIFVERKEPSIGELRFYNADGQQVMKMVLSQSGAQKFDLSGLKAGIYTLVYSSSQGASSHKIMKL